VGEHPGEWPRDTVEIERVDDQHPVLELPVPEEASKLCLDRLLPMGRLFLVGAERAQLPLRHEQFLHRRGTQCARQLILQVGLARIEAKPLEIGAREIRAEAGSSEPAPQNGAPRRPSRSQLMGQDAPLRRALVAELVYGTPASTRDPARFAFAHGGKDGTPFPVDRETYDRTIETLNAALNGRGFTDC
jgi:hypothetical protein